MTFEPDGELDLVVAESLRDRAALATVHGRGIGEVRRRVRRRRQRQMAVGLVPAMAGLGWVVTRPASHAPLAPSGDGCEGTGSTYPPATTEWGSLVPTTITFDANGNVVDPNGNPLYTTTTGIVGPVVTDANGNYVDGNGSIITVPFITDANGYPATTVSYPVVGTTAPPPWTGGTTTLPPGARGPWPQGAGSYTIQYNDSLIKIADRFAVAPEEIAARNGWADGTGHLLFPGDVIAIPWAGYVVEDGDSLEGLATKFTVTADAIVEANGWSDGTAHVLQTGDVIAIPTAGVDLAGVGTTIVGEAAPATWPAVDSTTTTTICEPPSSTDVTPTTSFGDSTTAPVVEGDFTSTKVQVANCSAQNGVARMMSTALADAGFVLVDPISGTCDPKLEASYVIYDESVPGAKDVADTLARVLGDLHVEPAILPIKVESGAWADGSGVVLLLGNDLAGKTLDQIRGESVSGTTAPAPTAPEITFVDTAPPTTNAA